MPHSTNACVSVIIPTYNTETFLDQCLTSIRSQTYQNLEIICVNDGSTDNSLSIMQQHAEQDRRVRIIDKENGGYGAGCNRGISEATGEWISIIEPDDWIDPGMYEEMLRFAASFKTDIDIVKTPWWDVMYWDDPSTQKTYRCSLTGYMKQSTRPFSVKENSELLAHHPAIWSALYRRDFLLEHNIQFPEYPGAGWADNPFLIDTVCQAASIAYYDKPFYRYRTDLPGSTRNHTTADTVTRPFDRWLTMLDHLVSIGITQNNVLEALYRRGFAYVKGAIFDDGADNRLVVDGIHRVFNRMNPEIVLDCPYIGRAYKNLFIEYRGLDTQTTFSARRLGGLIKIFSCLLKRYGALGFFKLCFNRVFAKSSN